METESRTTLAEYEAQLIAELGEDKARKAIHVLIGIAGGIRITVPTWKQIQIEMRDKSIRAQFNGHNHMELSDAWRLSVRQIRRIVNNS